MDNKRLLNLLNNVAQIFDGWHVDTAWSEWDESIRKEVGAVMKELSTPRLTDRATLIKVIADIIHHDPECDNDTPSILRCNCYVGKLADKLMSEPRLMEECPECKYSIEVQRLNGQWKIIAYFIYEHDRNTCLKALIKKEDGVKFRAGSC